MSTYAETKKDAWVADKFTCPDAVGRNVSGNNGDYANYCIFNNAEDAITQCDKDPTCIGYTVRDGIYQLTRQEPIPGDGIFYSKSSGSSNYLMWGGIGTSSVLSSSCLVLLIIIGVVMYKKYSQ